MTVKEIEERLKFIESIKSDDEVAHIRQDKLFVDVLTEISNMDEWDKYNGSRSIELAKAALKVLEIDFSRWCA